MSGYGANIQKSIVFLDISNEQLEIESFKSTTYKNINTNFKALTMYVQDLYAKTKTKTWTLINQRPMSVEQYDAGQILTCPLSLVYGFDTIIIKIQTSVFVLVNRLILKCLWKDKGTKTRQFWKRSWSTVYVKLIKAMQYGRKQRHKLIELDRETNTDFWQ